MRICKTSDWLGTLPSVISLCIMQPLLACHFEHLIDGVTRKYEDITGFHNMDRNFMPYEENKQMATFCFLRYRLVGTLKSKKNFRIQNPGTFRPSHFCFVSSSKRDDCTICLIVLVSVLKQEQWLLTLTTILKNQ
jgi:hypothetical protein